MNEPSDYICVISDACLFRSLEKVKVYDNHNIHLKKNDERFCICICCDYPILKTSINQHRQTLKHKNLMIELSK